MDQIPRQAGVITSRVRRCGLEVLLITSRDTGRWVIPKRNVEPG
jgi:8-oxo-dGTP pyrophosphatase MutT (NUDIX family)